VSFAETGDAIVRLKNKNKVFEGIQAEEENGGTPSGK